MTFSVLLSLYLKENPAFLRQSLDSIFNQTLKANEVIMVLDGPITKELSCVVKEYENNYSQLKIVPLESNKGLGTALNEGLKHCSNDLIIRMDTDDICFTNRFERQVRFMTANPDIVASSAWLEEFETSIDYPVSIKKVPSSSEEIAVYGKSRNPLNHPAVIFRKAIVEAVGGYKHFPLFEDWYLWARLMAAGYKLANMNEPLVYFRTSTDMYKRRSGWKYAKDSFNFQLQLHKLGLIPLTQAYKSGIMRGVVYLLPNSLRGFIYKKLLRN